MHLVHVERTRLRSGARHGDCGLPSGKRADDGEGLALGVRRALAHGFVPNTTKSMLVPRALALKDVRR